MAVSDDERETLHVILDALLNARESLERVNVDALSKGQAFYKAWSEPRRDLTLNGSRFLRRVIGQQLHNAELSQIFRDLPDSVGPDNENLASLANALRSFLPLFEPTANNRHTETFVGQMIDDFMGIYWGDAPRFFVELPKRPGQHKRPFRFDRLRLKALDWEKFLAAAGLPAFERQSMVATAYRTQWDAIRKWAKPIEENWGIISWPLTPDQAADARVRYRDDPAKISAEIDRDGREYWAEKSNQT
ncbi:hypothetical protein [Sphingomicrobium marinum]|uniref:hypothetical protein n=1 Tax=Sphingomicrobium marinum TaxID=1227950 RepID=UPI00223F66A9|nr:hypothetical protein [Sphingomicrobium marinum]